MGVDVPFLYMYPHVLWWPAGPETLTPSARMGNYSNNKLIKKLRNYIGF